MCIKEEPDTWWHPPPEEYALDDLESRNRPAGCNTSNSDCNYFLSTEQKVKIREEVVAMTDVWNVREPTIDQSPNGHAR